MGLAPVDIEGKYEIVAKLNEGGMGEIYKVRHRLLDEIRVVKILRPQHEDDEELRARFAREARSAIRLRHPNVVQIFDFSLDDSGSGLIVMEHIPGCDLSRLVDARRLPSLPLALEIGRQSLRALGFLHRHGFVHRDVSPDNLMLTLDVEGRPLVKLIDLGIAKSHQAEQTLTVSGAFLGKFRYASPEHFGSQGPDGTEPRSDLYTFGLVFYELLTGHYPISGDSTSQLIAGHLFNSPISFERSDPQGRLPPALRALLLRTLEKKADDRQTGAAECIAEIEALQRDHPLAASELEEARRLTESSAAEENADTRSTQNRLDRAFGREASSAGGSGPDSSSFEVLLDGAEALFQLGQSEQALQQVKTILAMDPDHRGAKRLLERLEDPESSVVPIVTQPPPLPPEAAALAVPPEAVESIEKMIEAGELVRADRELSGLLQQHGGSRPLELLRQRLEDLFHAQLASKIRGLLSEADALVNTGDYPEALRRLRDAQSLAPSSGPLHLELAQGVESLRYKIEARERRLAVEKIEQHVLHLVREKRLDEARSELRRAEDVHGDDEVFESLGQILDRAVSDRQVELVNEAGQALQGQDYEQAVLRLEEVLRLDPSNGWVQDQLDRARRHVAEAAEKRRIDEERKADFDAVDEALGHRDPAAADQLLATALARWGEDPRAPEMRRELARLRAMGLLENADAAQEDEDFFKARLLIAQASEVAPEDTMIGRLAERLDSEVERKVQEDPVPLDEQAGVLHTVAKIERLRVEGESLEAWKAVQQAIEHFGEERVLLDLRQDLAEEILEGQDDGEEP
ncbi:MAG: protein kinase [Acidobacteriota bacterium]